MTPARVRACSRLASRAINLGASAAWRSNTLRFTTMMVSILGAGVWPDRRAGGPAVRSAAIVPTASPPLRQTALFEQVNSLMQRIAHVAGGVVPFRKIQGRVHATRDLPQRALLWRPRVSSGRDTPSQARQTNGNNVEQKRRATALHKNVAQRRETDATVS